MFFESLQSQRVILEKNFALVLMEPILKPSGPALYG